MERTLYTHVKLIVIWKKFCYDLLCEEIKSREDTIRLKPNQFSKLIYKYYVDAINFPDHQPEIFQELIWKIGVKTNLEDQVIANAIESAQRLARAEHIEDAHIKTWREGKNMVKISISGIHTTIPLKIAEQLELKGRKEFYNLCLRYNVLGPSDGLFLSIDKDVYHYLKESSELPTVECYASPFNHNLERYCSVYPEDAIYGSLGCYRSFIEDLDEPVRLILNPPYTNRMMEECINLLLKYMERHQDAEFVAMLPLMNGYEPMIRLFESPGTTYRLIEGDNYTIHDHSKDCAIIAPMNLILVANLRGDSQECVDDIAQFLSVKAINLKNEKVAAKASRPWRSSKSGMSPRTNEEIEGVYKAER
ncbi:Phosphorylated CTD interacting factor 1 WW domain-containing protein [uncultured virus]|nr:Phosphorylated CTD interacting factor 1 WW domain-containing protein [uncultured virus]